MIIITWVSASWKTTLQNKLVELWYKKPINFTTRRPRNDDEADEYVFLSKEQFIKKLMNWDFLEFTYYNWNFYRISKYISDDTVLVLDPVWRAQVLSQLSKIWKKAKTIYLKIWTKCQRERILARWGSKKDIEERADDIKWFHPTPSCNIIDWEAHIDIVLDRTLKILNYNKK